MAESKTAPSVPVPDPVVEAAKVEWEKPHISFDKWFASLSLPLHHKQGMLAYTDCSIPRTVDEWKKVFANY
jgi:hypothetical protein